MQNDRDMYGRIRTLLTLLALTLTSLAASAQSVQWDSKVEPVEGNQYRIVLEATIPAGYHMYDMGPYEAGPMPPPSPLPRARGLHSKAASSSLSTAHRFDQMFQMEIGTFSGKAQFAQRVTLTAAEATLKAQVEWMICDDTSCMPPEDTELTITLPGGRHGRRGCHRSRPGNPGNRHRRTRGEEAAGSKRDSGL